MTHLKWIGYDTQIRNVAPKLLYQVRKSYITKKIFTVKC